MKRRIILAASEPKGLDAFNDTLGDLQDDVDYLVDSLDKIARDGDASTALQLTLEAKQAINALIEKCK